VAAVTASDISSPRMTFRQMLAAGWRLSVNANPSDFIVAKDGPGKYSYVGHHGNCYIEGVAQSWADLERTFHRRHHAAIESGAIHVPASPS
jgi:hypothetical protein